MKSRKSIIPKLKIIVGFWAAIILFSFQANAQKVKFLTSSSVPAARGFVKIKKDNNKNYLIQIHLYGLAEVERIQPPRKSYVIWMESDQGITTNLGKLDSSSSLISRKLKASFETTTSSRPKKIYISAEDEGDIQYPGSLVVLSTNSF